MNHFRTVCMLHFNKSIFNHHTDRYCRHRLPTTNRYVCQILFLRCAYNVRISYSLSTCLLFSHQSTTTLKGTTTKCNTGKLSVNKYLAEPITTDCRMFRPFRPLSITYKTPFLSLYAVDKGLQDQNILQSVQYSA